MFVNIAFFVSMVLERNRLNNWLINLSSRVFQFFIEMYREKRNLVPFLLFDIIEKYTCHCEEFFQRRSNPHRLNRLLRRSSSQRRFFFIFRIRLFVFFIGLGSYSCAQNAQQITYIQQQEPLLKELGHAILYGEEDSIRVQANDNFMALLEKCLQQSESFDYEFDSVPSLIKLKSEDKKVKIYNWNLPYKNGSYKYLGFVQVYNKKSKAYVVHKLFDKSDEINKPELATVDNYKWWGCLYYKMVEKTYKGTTYYTLLGWDGNDITSNKKVIDVLTINNQGFLKFGAPIFEYTKEKKVKKRVIFEYNKQAVMALRYESLIDQIVFDGLAPIESRFTGQYAFYGPDLSFDAFTFKNGKWVYIPEIDILKDDRFVVPKK